MRTGEAFREQCGRAPAEIKAPTARTDRRHRAGAYRHPEVYRHPEACHRPEAGLPHRAGEAEA